MEPTTETPVRDAPQQAAPAQRALPPASDKDLRWQRIKEGNPRFRVALIIGAIVLLIAVFFVWRYLGSYESTDDAQIDGHIDSISARVSGHVQKLLVEDNQYVQAGTPLVQIDPQDYQVALDTAKAAYADAAATAQAAAGQRSHHHRQHRQPDFHRRSRRGQRPRRHFRGPPAV